MQTVAVARNAMATRFEIVLHGEDSVALRAAGEEALDEIQRIEGQLSLYQPTSEIAHMNARAAKEPVRVTPSLFKLLERAKALSAEMKGAFDITIAPLVRCWGFMGGTGRKPEADELAEAQANVGMHLVELNGEDFTIRFARKGVMLDLGAIGKGYAVERAAEIIRELGISSALINGGTSSIYALGSPPDAESWKVAIQSPAPSAGVPGEPFATIQLKDEALSVSAVWGKSFQSEGVTLGHVLDPRSGRPVAGASLAAVALPSATETDAFSTGLLVSGRDSYEHLLRIRPQAGAILVLDVEAGQRLLMAQRLEVRNQDKLVSVKQV